MGWKYFNYECKSCEHVFECMVDSSLTPDPCPKCGAEGAERTVGGLKAITTYVPDYPGANYHRAGYGAELRRPAEKAGRQIAMPSGASSIFKNS